MGNPYRLLAMAQELICEYCGNRIQVASPQDIPEDCPNCNSPLEDVQLQESPQTQSQQGLHGFTLTYLKTNETVTIPHVEQLILGREASGRELLEKIEYISREHCKIEALDDHYCVTDLGSRNGTYIGKSRIDCCQHPRQVLQDGEILVLGRETFRVTLHNADHTALQDSAHEDVIISEDAQVEEVPDQPKSYECEGCHGYISDEKEFVCPKCGTYNDA